MVKEKWHECGGDGEGGLRGMIVRGIAMVRGEWYGGRWEGEERRTEQEEDGAPPLQLLRKACVLYIGLQADSQAAVVLP